MPTALFVQRDTAYHLVCRTIRGSMTREQWDHPAWQRDAIGRAWAAAPQAIRASDEHLDLVTPAPVTLFYAGGGLLCADTRLGPKAPHRYIHPDGRKMQIAPVLAMCTVRHTTYKHWAEGPLFHVAALSKATAGLSPEDKRAIDSLPNAALRERALAAVSAAGRSVEAQDAPDMRDVVDFTIRGIFKTKDYTVLESKQSDQGAKLVLSDGTVWDGRDDEAAPDSILGD